MDYTDDGFLFRPLDVKVSNCSCAEDHFWGDVTLIKLNMKSDDASPIYVNSDHIIAIYTIDGSTRIVTTATNGNGSSLSYAVIQPIGDVISKVVAAEAVTRGRDLHARNDGGTE
jgi:hypothetical protein